jgi:hypothetical protein
VNFLLQTKHFGLCLNSFKPFLDTVDAEKRAEEATESTKFGRLDSAIEEFSLRSSSEFARLRDLGSDIFT